MDVALRRLVDGRLVGSTLTRPDEVVRWHGAVQAQEHLGVRWAVAQRAPGLTQDEVTAALDAGTIIRTHALRPTWHLLAAEDVRWVQRATAHRVHVANRSRYTQLGLDDATFARAHDVLADAVRGGRHLTRPELGEALVDGGVDLAGHAEPGQRLAHLVMHAELEQVLVNGVHRGKQRTYALLDERVPGAPERSEDDDLAELARRYVQARSSVTAEDLSWWSGLTLTGARHALAVADIPRTVPGPDGRPRYELAPLEVETVADGPQVHLLWSFDELQIGLRDRSAVFGDEVLAADAASPATLRLADGNLVTLDGRAVGRWQRTLGAASVRVTVQLLARLDLVQRAAVTVAAERFAASLGLVLDLEVERLAG